MITRAEYENALIERHGKSMFEKLKNSSAAIAGLGGLGSNIAIHLARAGVGKLCLVDFDRVDISNLNRQQYDIDDLGKIKTDALSEKIKRFNPFIHIITHSVTVTEKNALRLFEGYGVVCEAFDKAENKAMLVNTLLSESDTLKIVSGSGMAGIGSANKIVTKKINNRLYLSGDGESDVEEEGTLFASRVAVCAAHEANIALQILLDKEEI